MFFFFFLELRIHVEKDVLRGGFELTIPMQSIHPTEKIDKLWQVFFFQVWQTGNV